MNNRHKTLDELIAEDEPRMIAEREKSYDAATIAQRSKEEFERGVRLGWWNEDGESIEIEDDEDDGE